MKLVAITIKTEHGRYLTFDHVEGTVWEMFAGSHFHQLSAADLRDIADKLEMADAANDKAG